MASYIVAPGDTFELVSSKVFGEPSKASTIKASNPGAADPPTPGTILIVPDVVPIITPTPGVGPVDCEIQIDGNPFRFWQSIGITRSLDSVDTFEFQAAPADSPAFRKAVRPLSFAPVSVLVGGDPIITGTMVRVDPGVAEGGAPQVSVAGYSRPGVLGDCTAPVSAFPTSFVGLSILDIARKLGEPYGIDVATVRTDHSHSMAPFHRVRLQATDKILPWLAGLAKRRKLYFGSTAAGELELRGPPVVASPVARLVEGQSPLTSIALNTSPQDYYSHVTLVRSLSLRGPGAKHTVPNKHLDGILRSLIARDGATEPGEERETCEAIAGRMWAGAVEATATVATWLDPQGVLWAPGSTVSVLAPGAMIYTPTDWIVRDVALSRTDTKTEAVLTLMLPGSFSGSLPDVLPWDV